MRTGLGIICGFDGVWTHQGAPVTWQVSRYLSCETVLQGTPSHSSNSTANSQTGPQVRSDGWPLIVNHRVESRGDLGPIFLADRVVAPDTLEGRTDLVQRRSRAKVVLVRVPLHADASERLKGVLQLQELGLGVGAGAPR